MPMIKHALRSLLPGDHSARDEDRVSFFPVSGGAPELASVALGFVPLTDAAPLIVAAERGYFADEGIAVTLWRESSWASIRDKLAAGTLDGAQTLAPLPLAMHLGLTPGPSPQSNPTPMVVPLLLNRNGNAITVSNTLYRRMVDSEPGLYDLSTAGAALRACAVAALAVGAPLLFATVFPCATHTYLLRDWLARHGIPHDAIRLIVVPPPLMVESLAAGRIDGCIVGEPWNTLAAQAGVGHLIASSRDIRPDHPEKAFALSRRFADAHPQATLGLTRAILRACAWLDQRSNRTSAAGLISARRYVGAPIEALNVALGDRIQRSRDEAAQPCENFLVFHAGAANVPAPSEIAWYLDQMVRWGELPATPDTTSLAAEVYKTDLYTEAFTSLNTDANTTPPS